MNYNEQIKCIQNHRCRWLWAHYLLTYLLIYIDTCPSTSSNNFFSSLWSHTKSIAAHCIKDRHSATLRKD